MKLRKSVKIIFNFMLVFCMLTTLNLIRAVKVYADSKDTLTYSFQGKDATTAGFAQGTIELQSQQGGTYYLYWADNKKALDGYYEITKMYINKGQKGSFTFGEQVAIPTDATKVIAIKSTEDPKIKTVAKADVGYEIPKEKLLVRSTESPLYTFNSYSDIHIDEEKWGTSPASYWEYSEKHWAQALQYAVNKKTDFIVSSGDQVTNAAWGNVDKEWKVYQNILSKSDYVNPVYESGGNHEVRQDAYVKEGLNAFAKSSGLNGNINEINSDKTYFTVEEPNTKDLFIFMSLEKGYRPAKYDEFTPEQLDWLEQTLKENYGKGKNIYLIQHALISGYGAGDNKETPYYNGSIDKNLPSAKRFISLIEKYPDIVWISGHTHEDYRLNYNYSNNDGTSCNMIHNSSVANPTQLTEKDGKKILDYSFVENNSQGYYVQVYKGAIIFSGANLCDQKIFPAYSYIIKGNTTNKAKVSENYTLVNSDITTGNVDSILENVKNYLAINYEYTSYDQYQKLKKCYYEYKDTDVSKLSASQLREIYSKLSNDLTELNKIINNVK